MATFVAGTANTVLGAEPLSLTRTFTAGDGGIAFIKWENAATLDNISDTAGGVWVVASQQAHGASPQPIGALAYCLSHPGGSATLTANFTGGTPAALFEMDILSFRPASGKVFAYDGAATPGVGSNNVFSTGSTIVTTAAGVVVQAVAGFQLCTGVTAGGTPTFTRDTATENTGGTSFAQYLLSGSAQTVTPGASWGASGAKYVMVAIALKEVDAGGASTPRQLLLGVG